ncbi:acetylxylan esterase [Ruania halotolerans]|uniref:acetylxylan esterase n=1 Tax=Ruania halotolerans TaxID=2897773 RepID=UPI001E38B98E|nr:acetylxylan esterase [Ruania halotolerans]UFU07615.1 acetylxylan esterase [Ruania halotolerans]
MPRFDLPLEELRTYRNPRPVPSGLAAYWERTLDEARGAATSGVRCVPAETGLVTVDAYDVTFPGFGGDEIKAWWLLPRGATSELPVVIELLGYGGGRGRVHERLHWASHGFAQLVVDSRGQGSIWNAGATPDPHGSGPAGPGMLTRGVDHPDHLYYRRLITDVVRAVDAVGHLPGADPRRVATVGHSQGGALALAAAALHSGVAATAARAPFLCGIARAVELTDAPPYGELAGYLAVHRTQAENVLAVLDHVDVSHLAPQIACPTWISVGLTDVTCPPSGIFGAINAMPRRPEQVRVWPWNGHEAGGPDDDAHLADWLTDTLT